MRVLVINALILFFLVISHSVKASETDTTSYESTYDSQNNSECIAIVKSVSSDSDLNDACNNGEVLND